MYPMYFLFEFNSNSQSYLAFLPNMKKMKYFKANLIGFIKTIYKVVDKTPGDVQHESPAYSPVTCGSK